MPVLVQQVDGFRCSHQVHKIPIWEAAQLILADAGPQPWRQVQCVCVSNRWGHELTVIMERFLQYC